MLDRELILNSIKCIKSYCDFEKIPGLTSLIKGIEDGQYDYNQLPYSQKTINNAKFKGIYDALDEINAKLKHESSCRIDFHILNSKKDEEIENIKKEIEKLKKDNQMIMTCYNNICYSMQLKKEKESIDEILHKEEITDTQRLSFVEKNKFDLSERHGLWAIHNSQRDSLELNELREETLRELIDMAIRRKNGD